MNYRKTRVTALALILTAVGAAHAMSRSEFSRLWTIESEAADYELHLMGGDTVEIVSPRGMTVWRNERIEGGRVTVEFDACLMVDPDNVPSAEDKPGTKRDRPSDLNCFWMARDPAYPDDIMARSEWRSGVFARCYSLRLYYMGYGGNGNTTTRFRRYDGDERGVDDARHRPAIIAEYTDDTHLNVANRWRHVKVTSTADGHVEYWMDGERLVDFRDAEPLTTGWFGIRTTWSRLRFANFRCTVEQETSVTRPTGVELRWIGAPAMLADKLPARFGVPFRTGEVNAGDRFVLDDTPLDFRPLAFWPDGSVKWGGFVGAVAPRSSYTLRTDKAGGKRHGHSSRSVGGGTSPASGVLCYAPTAERGLTVDNGIGRYYFARGGSAAVVDSIVVGGRRAAGAVELVATMEGAAGNLAVADSVRLLRAGSRHAVVRAYGHLAGASTSSFVVDLYLTADVPQVFVTHTFIYNVGNEESAPFGQLSVEPMITALALRFHVPMRGEEVYNRHVAFGTSTDWRSATSHHAQQAVVWHEPVQPLHGRRVLAGDVSYYTCQMDGERIAPIDSFADKDRALIDDWATWDGFRLSQPNDMGYTIRKRAKGTAVDSGAGAAGGTPWIGTFSGLRADGTAYVGSAASGLAVALHDFWQSYPSTLQVDGATTDEATLTVYLWSPEAEPMDVRHYDIEPHGLNASYEDVQQGMSSAYGIARTSEVTFTLVADSRRTTIERTLGSIAERPQLMCTPQYLHDVRAFGVWSLPDTSTAERRAVEEELTRWADFMAGEQDSRHWYGFWNYGDVMHNYDGVRGEWNYDVGGFAWDNTELASNMMLWYNFLRTGRADLWRMAVAMTRHTSEVDVYHLGPWSGLGSRHNVTHWGCGAKESRISQAAWNRFYYYLSGGDDRTGDLMTAVRDADTLLYKLDPMRLAQPRELFPCTAPARLRIGPDWLGYVANWMTEWERTGDVRYRDKILAGMASINALPHGIFTGPKALGYDPATGVVTYEGDTSVLNTNHLLPIMGGFEVVGELLASLTGGASVADGAPSVAGGDGTGPSLAVASQFQKTWLAMCRDYREMADSVSHNGFLIPRLHAYAYLYDHDPAQREAAWRELWRGRQRPDRFSTNGISTWALDAIYMLEVCP